MTNRHDRQVLRHQKMFRHRPKPGTAPGTLRAAEGAATPVMTLMAYSMEELVEVPIEKPDDIQAYIGKFPMVWVNVDGLGDTAVIERLGDIFGFHPLAMEDVLNVIQRPKIEEYDNHIFAVMRMPRRGENGADADTEQLSLLFGENFVVSFQEHPGDSFDPVRERLRKGGKRIRMMQADYLAYALIDAIVDSYFPVLEEFGEQLNGLEDFVIETPDNTLLEKIHEMKHSLHALRRDIWPMREALSRLSSGDLPFVHDETQPYLRDCYDHVIQVIDILETYRERASGLTDIYLSSISNRMNEVMKVLTIIATIFIPLGFIAGLYGMNFNPQVSPYNMPELDWYYGYPAALGLMAAVAVGLLIFFRRKGWL